MVAQAEKSFEFGRNWKRFVKTYLTDERLAATRLHLSQMLELESFEKRTFLDIGCGSGIHSLAAYHLGAERIVSFDVDCESVEATEMLRSTVENPAHWEVRAGSILDDEFVANLGSFDIVYAWGCLHHTGAMWSALKNAASLVRAGGRLYIAIYNYDEGAKGSHYWAKRKGRYVSRGRLVRGCMVLSYIFKQRVIPSLMRFLMSFENPFRAKKKARGMGYLTDVIDWLGGYPYEFAKPEEIRSFCEDAIGMRCLKTRIKGGLSNNEFIFEAQGSAGDEATPP